MYSCVPPPTLTEGPMYLRRSVALDRLELLPSLARSHAVFVSDQWEAAVHPYSGRLPEI
jgi:hypothetical protein